MKVVDCKSVWSKTICAEQMFLCYLTVTHWSGFQRTESRCWDSDNLMRKKTKQASWLCCNIPNLEKCSDCVCQLLWGLNSIAACWKRIHCRRRPSLISHAVSAASVVLQQKSTARSSAKREKWRLSTACVTLSKLANVIYMVKLCNRRYLPFHVFLKDALTCSDMKKKSFCLCFSEK